MSSCLALDCMAEVHSISIYMSASTRWKLWMVGRVRAPNCASIIFSVPMYLRSMLLKACSLLSTSSSQWRLTELMWTLVSAKAVARGCCKLYLPPIFGLFLATARHVLLQSVCIAYLSRSYCQEEYVSRPAAIGRTKSVDTYSIPG